MQDEPERKAGPQDEEDAPLELAPIEDAPAAAGAEAPREEEPAGAETPREEEPAGASTDLELGDGPTAAEPETPRVTEPVETRSDLHLEDVPPTGARLEAPEEEPEAAAAGEEQVPDRLPTLEPLDLGGILAWPLTGDHAVTLLGGLFIVLLVFTGAWLVDRFFAVFEFVDLGVVGTVLRLVIAGGAGVWYLAYPYRTIRAAHAGRTSPPDWLEFDPSEGVYVEGGRTLGLLAIYASPAALAWILGAHPALVLALALASWCLVPAALLLLVASESLLLANPGTAFRLAVAGGKSYLACLVPVAPFLVARLLWGPSFIGVILEWLAYAALVLTSFMLGLLARESEQVETVALAAGWLGEVSAAETGAEGEEE